MRTILPAALLLVGFMLLGTVHAAAVTLSPSANIVDVGQNVVFSVNLSNQGIGPYSAQLFNESDTAPVGNSITILGPVYYGNTVQNGDSGTMALPSSYGTYICAMAVNYSATAFQSSWSWSDNAVGSDPYNTSWGPLSSVGTQVGNVCSASATGNYIGDIVIGGVGVAGYPVGTSFEHYTPYNPSQPDILEYNVPSSKALTIIVISAGGGNEGSNVISSVDLSSAVGCSERGFVNSTDAGQSESIYVAVCTGQDPTTNKVTVHANGYISMAAYVFGSYQNYSVGSVSLSLPAPAIGVDYRAEVTNIGTGAVSWSNTVSVTVDPDPVVGISVPGNVVAAFGQNVTLTATASLGTGNPANFTYQWYYANATDVPIYGATGMTYNALMWFPGTYNYIVSAIDNVGYTALSNALSLSISGTPILLTASSNTVDAGQNVIFTSSSPDVGSYTVLEGSSAAPAGAYGINGNVIHFTAAGTYRVIEAVDGYNGLSEPVAISVNSDPQILKWCNFDDLCQWDIDGGQTASPSVLIEGGTQPFNVIWYVNGVENAVANIGAPPGSSFPVSTISIPEAAVASGSNVMQNITVNITDAAGAKATFAQDITVYPLPVAGSPGIIIPRNVMDVGQSMEVYANVIGGVPYYSSLWELDGNSDGSLLGGDGGGLFTYVYPSRTQIGNAVLTAVVDDNEDPSFGLVGFGTTNPVAVNATITVNPELAFSTNGIVAPYLNLSQGQNENLSIGVVNGTPPYTYAWSFEGKAIDGDTAMVFVGANSSDTGDGVANVVVGDAVGETLFSSIAINFTATPAPSQNTGGGGGTTGGGVPSGGGNGPNVTAPTTVATASTIPASNSTTASVATTTVAPGSTIGSNELVEAPSSSAGLSEGEITAGALMVVALLLTMGYFMSLNSGKASKKTIRKMAKR